MTFLLRLEVDLEENLFSTSYWDMWIAARTLTCNSKVELNREYLEMVLLNLGKVKPSSDQYPIFSQPYDLGNFF